MDLFYGIVKPFVWTGCIFNINIGGWLEKSKWDIKARIRMIGVVAKVVNYRF